MRASWGECSGRSGGGVLLALWLLLAPLVKLAMPGDGICWWWYAKWGCVGAWCCGCGDEVICWLRPDALREGIWRFARLSGDCSDGDAMPACGGVSLAGESCGESSELMSMMAETYSSEAGQAGAHKGIMRRTESWTGSGTCPRRRQRSGEAIRWWTAWNGWAAATQVQWTNGSPSRGRVERNVRRESWSSTQVLDARVCAGQAKEPTRDVKLMSASALRRVQSYMTAPGRLASLVRFDVQGLPTNNMAKRMCIA